MDQEGKEAAHTAISTPFEDGTLSRDTAKQWFSENQLTAVRPKGGYTARRLLAVG